MLNNDGLVGIDIDKCVLNGVIGLGAIELMNKLGGSYFELSPSGTGVRGFGYGDILDKGTSGTGSPNKVPFIAAVETTQDGRPLYAIFSKVKTFGREDVKKWAIAHLTSTSIVVSDGLDCFKAVKVAGATHTPSVVGKTRKSSDMPCFRWINTILSNLKTATSGTYHALDFDKYGFLYLAEAQYRFNRRFDMSAIFTRLLHAAGATGNRSEAWMRLAEDER